MNDELKTEVTYTGLASKTILLLQFFQMWLNFNVEYIFNYNQLCVLWPPFWTQK